MNGRVGRIVGLVVAALALLSLVTMASHRPLLRARTRYSPPSSASWPSVVAGLLVAAGAVIVVHGLIHSRRHPGRSPGANGWSVLAVVVMVAVAGLLARHARPNRRSDVPPTSTTVLAPAAASPARPAASLGRSSRGHSGWWEAAALAVAAGLALAVAWPRAAAPLDASPDALATALDESLDDLRAEPDPRRAVIAAYARMERRLAFGGAGRHPAEAPLEYLSRLLAGRRMSTGAVSRLTELFELAKFSDHDMTASTKEAAITALAAVREELRSSPRAQTIET